MSDNYPVGAANDTLAPYNREDAPTVDVRVRETLVRETTVRSRGGHTVMVWDYDETVGRDVCTECYEAGNVEQDYRDEHRTALDCLHDCAKVLRKLKRNQYLFVGGVNLSELLAECEEWEQESIDINER